MPDRECSDQPPGIPHARKGVLCCGRSCLRFFKASDPAIGFPVGRTIEFLLKSYLLSVGVSVERLRSREFGHNLVALYTEARTRGIDPLIGSDSVLAGLMQLLNLEYGSKRLEYRESGTMYSIPDAEIARAVIRRLLKGINLHLRENGS